MWPVSRREAILHFAQNSAETSRSNRVRRPEDLPRDLSEKTRCGFHRTGPTSLQPVRSLKAPDMGTVHTQGCGPLFRWRLLVVAAAAVNDRAKVAVAEAERVAVAEAAPEQEPAPEPEPEAVAEPVADAPETAPEAEE